MPAPSVQDVLVALSLGSNPRAWAEAFAPWGLVVRFLAGASKGKSKASAKGQRILITDSEPTAQTWLAESSRHGYRAAIVLTASRNDPERDYPECDDLAGDESAGVIDLYGASGMEFGPSGEAGGLLSVPPDTHPAVLAQLCWLLSERVRLASGQRLWRRRAHRDALTRVANRRGWSAWWRRRNRLAESWLVALLDLDNFKELNDRCGHLVGDQVLQQVAAALRSVIPPGAQVARWGGDEFALAIPAPAREPFTATTAQHIADRLPAQIAAGVWSVAEVTASVGIAWTGTRLEDAATVLLNQADQALRAAKRAARGVRDEG